jgi:hypothetical protein
MIGFMTYLHIFLLFPVLFYVILINNRGKLYSPKVTFFMYLLSILILIAHVMYGGWLKQTPTFITLQTNLGNVFSGLPLNSKYIVIVYAIISTGFYYLFLK